MKKALLAALVGASLALVAAAPSDPWLRASFEGASRKKAPPAPAAAVDPTATPKLELPKLAAPAGHTAGETKCGLCHKTTGWREVSFAHDRTGFPLKGLHDGAPCRSCHAGAFDHALPRNCAGCHEDPHGGELGLRCEGCHEEKGWEPLFDADAHRRTAFPLGGRHAILPCTECHAGANLRSFATPPKPCVACHSAERALAARTSIDHDALGFSSDCVQCHNAFGWERGRWVGHDRCFQISTGDHAGIACEGCHTSLAGVAVQANSCSTNTASCVRCHSCGSTDGEHGDVEGYQCRDRKCYECHRFTTRTGDLKSIFGGGRR